jgi:hypothetical protein
VRGEPATPGLPAVVLIRPDGYVAWAGDNRPDLAQEALSAVARWCGSRRRGRGGAIAAGGRDPERTLPAL